MAEALDARGVEGKQQVALSAAAPSHGVGSCWHEPGPSKGRWADVRRGRTLPLGVRAPPPHRAR
eukprot:1848909-Rhodomonas_salina.1